MTVAKFRNQRAYARNGMVHIVDEVTGDERSVSYTDFTKERIIHLRQMRDHREATREERREYQKAMDEAIAVAYEARQQGDPLRPPTEAETRFARERAREIAEEKLHDINKIVTLDDVQKAQIHGMAERGYAPVLVDEFGNKLV